MEKAKIAKNQKSRPVKQFKFGSLRAAVWANTYKRKDGTPFRTFSVTIQRRFFNKKTQNWQSTSTLRANDVGIASKLLMEAFSFIEANSGLFIENKRELYN